MIDKSIALLFFLIFSSQIAYGQNLLIRNVNLIDGIESNIQKDVDIEVINGVIARIGRDLESEVKKVIEANNLFAMPGLIDCHTHLKSIPGNYFRNETTEEIQQQIGFQLKSYLAAGVTTVLDAAAEKSLEAELSSKYGKENIPRIKVLSPFFTPVDGYFSDEKSRGLAYKNLWEPVQSVEMVNNHFESLGTEKPVGVKVTFEEGFGPFRVWPLFKPEIIERIITESKKRELPIFVHSMSENEYKAALKIKPYAFVHAGFNDGAASDEMVDAIKNSEAYVISTLAILKMTLLMWDHDALEDPWLRRLVPESQLLTARNSNIRKRVIEEVVLGSKPSWIPTAIARLFSGWFFNKAIIERGLEHSKETVRKMARKGIPLVMGSDAGNWPVWTTFYHGVGTILEMEALQEAGLDSKEIIRAATSRAAKTLKIENEVGSIEVGKIADILLVERNPLENIKSLRKLNMVIKSGQAKKPIDWVSVRKSKTEEVK